MQFETYAFSDIRTFLREEGRVTIDTDGISMDWSACGFTFRFYGDGVTLYNAYFPDFEPCYILITVDGIRSRYGIGRNSIPVRIECADGEHTVTVLRLSEGAAAVTFASMTLSAPVGDTAPHLLSAPPYNPRRLVFFGDSITCGFGNLAPADAPFRTVDEDPTRAYAYRTAERLNAAAELISISGQGIVRNCLGDVDTPIPLFYAWQSREKRTPCDFSRQPDAVIVNAGTNDAGGGVTFEEFYDGTAAFLRKLRMAYPDAPIVWFVGLMGNYYDTVIRRIVADMEEEIGGLYYLPTATIDAGKGEVGACGHPSVEGAERGAIELSAFLETLLYR